MKRIVESLLMSALALSEPHVVLRTPVHEPGAGGLVCRVENASDEARSIRVEALDAVGEPTYDSGGFALAGGAVFLSGVGSEARSCRLTVDGSLDGLRLHGLLQPADGGTPHALVPRSEDRQSRAPREDRREAR